MNHSLHHFLFHVPIIAIPTTMSIANADKDALYIINLIKQSVEV